MPRLSGRRHPRLPERQPGAGLLSGHDRARQARDHGLRRRGPLQEAGCAPEGGVTPEPDKPAPICCSSVNDTSWRLQMHAVLAIAVAIFLAAAAPAHAQDWPQRRVTIVVPFAAGGSADLLARILQQHMQVKFGVPFVVENRSGARGSIGTGYVAKAAGDGYTLLVGTVSSNAINAFLYSKLNFDVARDFQAVSLLVRFPNLLFVNPKIPAKTVPELISYLKAN